jgi:serine-type D-Ala-D-Ala carboxypeptidase/endopeptidase
MKYFIHFYFLLFSIVSHGQSNATSPKEVVKSIEKRIEYGLNPSIVIGIIDKDGTHFFNFGKKSANGSAADEHTIYEIGSITKTFTAILLAQQEIDGKLKIDDPIKNYLPSQVKVPQRGTKEITFGNLSDHTSGLPRDADFTVDQMYSFLSGYQLTRDVGSAYEYSNIAQGLLGHILALNAGLTYESLMIQTIALPLGMNETKVKPDEDKKKNIAVGYSNGFEMPDLYWPTLPGAGSIRSSTYDMLKFLAANMGLTQSPLQSAINKTHEVRHDKQPDNVKTGLAWYIKKGKNGEMIYHLGGTYGYLAFAGFIKETGKGVVVLTNSKENIFDICFHLLNPELPLNQIKPNIVLELKKIIDSNGVEAAKKHFYDLRKNRPDDYVFSEGAINRLGYLFMEKNIHTALDIFKLNVELYPNSFNVYHSYGEALLKNGQQDSAIENYKRSVKLYPGNTNGIQALEKMGVKIEPVQIPEATVQSNELSPISCSREIMFRSATGKSTHVRFENRTSEALNIYWINYNGERVLYRTLKPKKSYVQQTYTTHPWIVVNKRNHCFGIFMPEPVKMNAIITE